MDYTQFKRALSRLNEMLRKYESSEGYEPLIVDALREALAQRFEYSLEVAWKTCKRHLSEQGFIEAREVRSLLCVLPSLTVSSPMLRRGYATLMPDRTRHTTTPKKNLMP